MATFTEGRHPGEFLLSEDNFHRSRENVKVPASQTIIPGNLLGARVVVADAAVSASVGGSNTGNATIASASPAVTSKAKHGRYKGVATAATKVDWEDPSGIVIGTSTHGSLFAVGGIRVTITAGGTPNVAGDEFYVDVIVEDPLDFEFVPFNPAGTDGSEEPVAVALYPVTTGAGETAKTAVIRRAAEVKGPCLEFPSGISANNKAKAIAALAKVGIIVRF